MLRWIVFFIVVALLGAVVWARSMELISTQIGIIAVFFCLVAITVAYIYVKGRSRRRRPPPPV
jgi:intracellular septation protein A